jgi:Family of unknown function (DUF6526)
MAQTSPQTFEHHARYLPVFHFVVLPLLLLYLIGTIYAAATTRSLLAHLDMVLAVALILLALSARRMAVTVQDRVIRLEERLRMRALLPADLQPRVEAFTVEQLVGLRFASDEELPALARKVLDERIEDRKAVKRLVARWRPDHLRV